MLVSVRNLDAVSNDATFARSSLLPSRRGLPPIFAAILLLAGCGGAPYDLAPVRGIVTIDNQPFAQGKVMFAPIAQGENSNPGKPAFGLLGADGSFVLTTYADGDGAVVGEHWVSVIRMEQRELVDESLADEPPSPIAVTGPKFARVTYPQKVAVVAGQDNEVSISLTSQDIARFGRQ